MPAPRLHVTLIDGVGEFQDVLTRVTSPASEGGPVITAGEMEEVETSLREHVIEPVTEAADTLRFIGIAAGAGAESSWLARQFREHMADLETLNSERLRTAHAEAQLIVLEEYRQADPHGAAQ